MMSRCPSSMRVCRPLLCRTHCRFNRRLCVLSSIAPDTETPSSSKECDLGLVGDPVIRKPGDFDLASYRVIHNSRMICDRILGKVPRGRRKMVQLFDDLSNTLCRVADLAECMRSLHSDREYRLSAEKCCAHLLEFIESINTDVDVYETLRNVYEHGDCVPTTEKDKRIAELLLAEFEISGVHLPLDKREKFVRLTQDAFRAQVRFAQGCDLPASHAGKSVDGLHYVDPDTRIRERAYRLSCASSKEQTIALEDMRRLRHEIAHLCGYKSYAHRSLGELMTPDPIAVELFLRRLASDLLPRVQQERRILQLHMGDSASLEPWDVPYAIAHFRSSKYGVGRDLADYFSLPDVLSFLSRLSYSLFGVELISVPVGLEERWADHGISKLEVRENGSVLGYIYIDSLYREGKSTDCHFTVVGGRRNEDGSYQAPVVVLAFSLGLGSPVLLSPPQVENVFHEMGHALHSVLSRAEYQHVTGTRVSTDFSEVPSNLMECFLRHPQVLRDLAVHHSSREPLGSTGAENIIASSKCFGAHTLQNTVFNALADLRIHMTDEPLDDLYIRTYSEVYNENPVADTNVLHRFSHLSLYGSKYFVYTVAQAVAKQIWRQEFEDEPYSRERGSRLRSELLQHGGEIAPTVMLENYLGKMPTLDTMASALIAEVDSGLVD